jgi:ankyrin repeat protein
LALETANVPNKVELARVLVDAGAELNEPFVACGSGNNAQVAELLLDSGASINGTGGWSPFEEALYWNSRDVIDLLLRRGAAISNLRIAAGVGCLDLIENFFNSDGSLKPEAGKINWPWGDLSSIAGSGHDTETKAKLAARFNSWSNDRQAVIDNAFVYASMHGHIDAAKLLLGKGAQVNTIPGGFDYAGSGLHYAALNGHLPMVEFLIGRGADVSLRDTKVQSTAAGWAEYGGHPKVKTYLERLQLAQSKAH